MAFLTNRHVDAGSGKHSVEICLNWVASRKLITPTILLILASLTTGCVAPAAMIQDDYGLRHGMNENQH